MGSEKELNYQSIEIDCKLILALQSALHSTVCSVASNLTTHTTSLSD